MPEDDLHARILRYLTEISRGELTLTGEQAMLEPDQDAQRILYGLVYLHEELVFREQANAARIAAEASDRAKSAFLTTMSHELRTPLNAILGYAEVVQEEARALEHPAVPQILSDLDRIHRAARNLLCLVNDVLALARIDAGQISSTNEPLDLSELLDEVRATLQPLANEKALHLRVEGPRRIVCSSRRLLLQCLVNLGANAIKFTDLGHVTIRAEVSLRGFGFVVEDSGRGMTRMQLERVIEPFEQVNPCDKGGTGLGLTITRRFVEHLGGTIELDSLPGHGTTVRVQVPHPGEPDLAP